MLKKIAFLILFISIAALAAAQNHFKQYHLIKRIAGHDSYGWDYAAVDEAGRHLFVSHGVKVLVVDIDKDSIIGEIPHTPGVHGIAIAPKLNRGFTSNGRSNAVTVFDLTTLKTIDTVAITGQNPDAILYEPVSNRVFTFNGSSKNATVIDAGSLKILGTIALSGKPEFAVHDAKGNIFVNIEDKNTIVQINPDNLSVINEWPIAPGDEPSGLAIDIENKLLFSVCGNSTLVVFDYTSGKVLTTMPIGKGVDAVNFDPATKLIYSSNGEGTVTIIRQDSRDKYSGLQILATQKGCRTMALDTMSKNIYLSAGKYEDGKRSLLPDSFEILVFSNR